MLNESAYLFDMDSLPAADAEAQFRSIDTPLWTKNKARFIARYLKSFTYVTKHGTYIDAFAGPQHEESRIETWAAKLVMENKPAWLRNFFLFDADPDQISHLQELKNSYIAANSDGVKRSVNVVPGDCNETLPKFLREMPLKEKEASFCLLDQRSTECAWETVRAVATHKGAGGGNKIELFYFLPQGWIDRTIKSWRRDVEERCRRWWGKEGVMDFLRLSSFERGRTMARRFKDELGYKYSFPFPIQKEGERGCIMFWMIHASDHERATPLMNQAYRYIGAGGGLDDPIDQAELF
jgi:three-Cys-motif partner protein